MTDYKAISDLLVKKGKVRGKPVAITLFFDEIPESYVGQKVDPCGIVRRAMDFGERAYSDRTNFDCLSGAYTLGFHEGTPELRSGAYLARHVDCYTSVAAARIKSGNLILPQGLIKGIGAAPLDDVPEGVRVDWVVAVANPFNANNIAAVRAVKDGVVPRGACGTSLCGEIFAFPFHEDNVVITPGDMGGRMANKIKPDEMFVVLPQKYLGNLTEVLGQMPNVEGLLAATKPADSEHWKKKKKRSSKAPEPSATLPPPVSSALPEAPYVAQATAGAEPALIADDDDEPPPPPEFTMPWDEEAKALLFSAPPDVQAFAVGNVETFAEENGYKEITRQVIIEQMESVGLTLEMLTGM